MSKYLISQFTPSRGILFAPTGELSHLSTTIQLSKLLTTWNLSSPSLLPRDYQIMNLLLSNQRSQTPIGRLHSCTLYNMGLIDNYLE